MAQRPTLNPATQTWYVLLGLCGTPVTDCLPDVVVTPGKIAALEAAIENGPTAIGTFFSDEDNWDVFTDPMVSQMNELASGNYDIHVVVTSTANGDVRNYLCGETGFSDSDPEFVIPVTVGTE